LLSFLGGVIICIFVYFSGIFSYTENKNNLEKDKKMDAFFYSFWWVGGFWSCYGYLSSSLREKRKG